MHVCPIVTKLCFQKLDNITDEYGACNSKTSVKLSIVVKLPFADKMHLSLD